MRTLLTWCCSEVRLFRLRPRTAWHLSTWHHRWVQMSSFLGACLGDFWEENTSMPDHFLRSRILDPELLWQGTWCMQFTGILCMSCLYFKSFRYRFTSSRPRFSWPKEIKTEKASFRKNAFWSTAFLREHFGLGNMQFIHFLWGGGGGNTTTYHLGVGRSVDGILMFLFHSRVKLSPSKFTAAS